MLDIKNRNNLYLVTIKQSSGKYHTHQKVRQVGEMENRLIELSVNEIFEECLNSFIEFCAIQKGTARGERILQNCLEARKRIFGACKINILISPFDAECIKENFFRIGDKTIHYEGLKKLALSNVIGGYMYSVFTEKLPLDELELSTLQMYYADSWLSAYVDAGWKSLKAILVNEVKIDFYKDGMQGKIVVSESLAPGYHGMPLESTEDLFQLMKLSEYGMELLNNSVIIPQKNVIGIYLAGIFEECIKY